MARKHGGAVSVARCGTAESTSSSDQETFFPTYFSNCTFIGNSAQANGGAIEIVSGRARVENTAFHSNFGGEGGALMLIATVWLFNSSFTDNTSGEGRGPAIHNAAMVLDMIGLTFSGNRFLCATTEFLEWNEGSTTFAAICDGCDVTCQECTIENNMSVPNCTTLFEHVHSEGGTTTIESVYVDDGYWRSNNQSKEPLACYNAEACLGGLTNDPDYCSDGYEGPYCSVCREGYAATLAFVCRRCSDGNVAAVVVLFATASLAALVFVWHMVASVEQEKNTGGIAVRVEKVLPLQSIKILIVAWQIVTQFSSVANVIYPRMYHRLLDVLAWVNFDMGWILSAGCVLDADFHDGLLVATIAPIALVAVLGITYVVAKIRNCGSEDALHVVGSKHLSAVVNLSFFIYSSVSSAVFSTFACDELDDGKVYLRADYRIECDSSRHKAFKVYAGFMILVYPVGIPLFYTIILFREHNNMLVQSSENETSRYHSTSTLRKPYRPTVFYYEVVECSRRVLLTGVIVFIYPSTAAQIAVTTSIAFIFVIVAEGLRPYVSRWDSWVSRVGHVIVVLSMYVALLLKVDVSQEPNRDQSVFAGILVGAHVIMIFLVIVETTALLYSMRNQEISLPVPRAQV